MSAAAPDVDVDVDVDVGDGGGIARPSRAPDDAASTARDDARDADADDQRLGLLDVATPRGEFVVVALDAPRDDGDGDGDGDDARRREYTAVEALDHVGFGKFQIRALCFVGFAWAADAMEMMLLSFIGPAMRCEFGVSSDAEGALTSVVFVGMAARGAGVGSGERRARSEAGAAVQRHDDARGGDRKRAGRELRERVVL